MSDLAIDELFKCVDDVHSIKPSDPLEPSGSACMCGAISLIGVAAAVKGDRKVFLYYMIDATPVSDDDDEDMDAAFLEQAFIPR